MWQVVHAEFNTCDKLRAPCQARLVTTLRGIPGGEVVRGCDLARTFGDRSRPVAARL